MRDAPCFIGYFPVAGQPDVSLEALTARSCRLRRLAVCLVENDEFQTVDYAERFAAEIPRIRIRHIPMENEPAAVACALAYFFTER